jgi:hypothetical protein
MGLFGDYKPKISKNEFSEVRSTLRESMSKGDVDKVEYILRGSLDERQSTEKGIDKKELEKAMTYIKSKQSQLGFSNDKIEKIEKTLNDYL